MKADSGGGGSAPDLSADNKKESLGKKGAEEPLGSGKCSFQGPGVGGSVVSRKH